MSEGLGRAIRVIRTERGLNRKDLAARSGLSYPYLSEIEGDKKSPSSRALRAIGDALGVAPSELLAAADSLAAGPRTWAASAPSAPPAPSMPAPRMKALAEPSSRWFHRTDHESARTEAQPAPLLDALMAEATALEPQDLQRLVDLARRLQR